LANNRVVFDESATSALAWDDALSEIIVDAGPPSRASAQQPRPRSWHLAQGEHIVPIPGTRSAERVEENVAAADLQLTAEDLARITKILPNGGIGARFAGDLPVWD
jgi:predicted oxidoreductase